jgi:putative transport protein
VLILALVAGSGLALGSLRVRGIGLGIAGVLFTGLAFGHFGVHVDQRILEFTREFGLILFVYSIGLQVGPGFFASLRRHGLALNLLAAAIVLLGVATALGLHLLGGIDAAAVAGILSGATTNTPALAAAQQALKQVVSDPVAREPLARLPSVGYAVAYPFGVFGIILVMVGIRAAFRINLVREREELERAVEAQVRRPARANLEVANPNLVGMPLERVPLLAQSGIVVSGSTTTECCRCRGRTRRWPWGTCCSLSEPTRSSTPSGSSWERRATSTFARCRARSRHAASSSPAPPRAGRRSPSSTSCAAMECRSRG